jgi:metallo-beta-lactamase class B
MRLNRSIFFAAILIAASSLFLPSAARAQFDGLTIPPRANNENHKKEPFRVIGNIYWVGHTEVGAYLLKTSQGHILIDTTSTEQSAWVRESIEKLGLKMKHMGGFARFKELTGAKIVASKLTAEEMAVGGKTDFREDGSQQYTPVKADRIVADGDTVSLGGTTMTARITPGHTKGCTTWTTQVTEDGKKYDVVFNCTLAVAGPDRAPLFGNPKYPNVVSDFENSFRALKALPCDVFLIARASDVKMEEKEKRLKAGEKPNPFIDPAGCRDYIKKWEDTFVKMKAEQMAAMKK